MVACEHPDPTDPEKFLKHKIFFYLFIYFSRSDWRNLFKQRFGSGLHRPLEKEMEKKVERRFYKYQKALLRDKYRLVFATCNGAADARLKGTFFDLVLIDEAAQDTEPCTLIPFTRLHISGRVTLLIYINIIFFHFMQLCRLPYLAILVN